MQVISFRVLVSLLVFIAAQVQFTIVVRQRQREAITEKARGGASSSSFLLLMRGPSCLDPNGPSP
jgi:hypothetical protein